MIRKKLLVLEANIDDMNPEWFGHLSELLFEAGALDVLLIPAFMKKGRPATVLQVLVEGRRREKILEMIFRESTTLGVRSYAVDRFELKRETQEVRTPFGPVTVKIGRDRKGRALNVSPEYESCRRLAVRKKIPLKKIYASALAACRVIV